MIERSDRVGTRFLHELRRLGERYDSVKEVRGRGLMMVMEFEDDEHFSLDSVYHGLLERGFIVGYKPTANLLRFYPPLTIGKDDVARLLENLDHVLRIK